MKTYPIVFGLIILWLANNPVIAQGSRTQPLSVDFVPNGLTTADWTSIRQQAYVKPSTTWPTNQFGTSVAVSGNTVVVGAKFEDSAASGVDGNQNDNSATDSGAAYVFVRDVSGLWTQQAYLKASNSESNDEFGFSVAISGDTLVVGAPFEDSRAMGVNGDETDNDLLNSGAAYVFVRSGTNWTQHAYLKAANAQSSDQFGVSVAISDDTIVVGANREDSDATGVNGDDSNNSAVDSGAAYVFVRTATNWTQQAYLKASNTGAGDQFGWPVAVSGDTIVVSAMFEDSNASGVNGDDSDNTATSSGAAYVFVREGTTWTQQTYLKASNTEADDQFGKELAISAETVVVGAWLEDSGARGVNGDQTNNAVPDSGAAYVFVRSGTNWAQEAYLKASNTAGQNDRFGRSVAISGDTIGVGATREDSRATGINGNQSDKSAPEAGAAYLFARNGETWTQQAYLKASNTGAGDTFGISVAISGQTVIVGALFEDSGASGLNGDGSDNTAFDSGAAYVFSTVGRVELNVPADFATIQAAVDAAAAGDIIRIAPLDYYEQVVIVDKTNLTLVGEPGAVIHATPSMTQTLLRYGASNYQLLGIVQSDVVLTGLTLDGHGFADSYAGSLFIGILFRGSSGHVQNCTIRGFRGPTLTQDAAARGININNVIDFGTIDVRVSNSHFADNKISIFVAGNDSDPSVLRTSFTIEGNTFTGLGPNAAIVHYGIGIITGAGGEVRGNTIRDHCYTADLNNWAAGIAANDGRFTSRGFQPLHPVRLEGNTFSNNNVHAHLVGANGSQVANNVFQRTGPGLNPRGLILSGTNVLAANNDFSDMPTGIELAGGELFSGVPLPTAVIPKLTGNWFCYVSEPIRTQPLVTGLAEQGTESCPFRPTFQLIDEMGAAASTSTSLKLRSWHRQASVIERSSDLQNWLPVYTNAMTVPSFEYEDRNASTTSRLFYRARQQ